MGHISFVALDPGVWNAGVDLSQQLPPGTVLRMYHDIDSATRDGHLADAAVVLVDTTAARAIAASLNPRPFAGGVALALAFGGGSESLPSDHTELMAAAGITYLAPLPASTEWIVSNFAGDAVGGQS